MVISEHDFLETVFASPNVVWPNRDPLHPSAAFLEKFLQELPHRSEAPLVLPRKEEGWPVASTYVVCWSRSHAGRMRMLLRAWVAENWCDFDGRVAHLRMDDPLEAAILSLVGPGTTYLLRPPNTQAHVGLFRALGLMVNTIGHKPTRVNRMPRPVGRLLRDFETSLAAGQAATSLELLEAIEQSGGVSHENVAFLRIRRLGQLGEDQELLRSPSLATVVSVEPPRLVREAILGAWFRSTGRNCRTFLDSMNDGMRREGADIPLLVDDTLVRTTDPDAWAASIAISLARGDLQFATRLLKSEVEGVGDLRRELEILFDAHQEAAPASSETNLEKAFDSDVRGGSGQEDQTNLGLDPEPDAEVFLEDAAPSSWAEWLSSLSAGYDRPLTAEHVDGWTAPGESDDRLASAIQEFPLDLTDRLFTGLGAFIGADDPSKPAWRTSAELILRHLVGDYLTPSDLGAISALLAIFLRAAPGESVYRELLQDLADFRGRWSSIDTAATAIDIADLVVCAPTADSDARQAFVASALEPLHALRHRLPPSLRTVAALITADVALGWEWPAPDVDLVDDENSASLLPRALLLYSLDKGVLARAKLALGELYPSLTVHLSDAKVGSDALKSHVRSAEVVVLATRKATHAATLFIQSHVRESTRVAYADGCGSGSMMRAVHSAITDFGH